MLGVPLEMIVLALVKQQEKTSPLAMHEVLDVTDAQAERAKRAPTSGFSNKNIKGDQSTGFGNCDNSAREKDWRCYKRGTQAT
jgi:hypothetical protein